MKSTRGEAGTAKTLYLRPSSFPTRPIANATFCSYPATISLIGVQGQARQYVDA
jgi:hypothetical protein